MNTSIKSFNDEKSKKLLTAIENVINTTMRKKAVKEALFILNKELMILKPFPTFQLLNGDVYTPHKELLIRFVKPYRVVNIFIDLLKDTQNEGWTLSINDLYTAQKEYSEEFNPQNNEDWEYLNDILA